MSEPDKHHYLPVFYLKQWAGPDGKLIRYHRPHSKVVVGAIAPKNTGYERGLYGMEGNAPMQRNAIETEFMAPIVDEPASRALRVLIERDPKKMNLELRQAWTRFVMSLHVRHPDRVAHITEQAASSLRQILLSHPEEYDAVRGETDPSTLLEWVEKNAPDLPENFGKGMLPSIITHQPAGNEIFRMQWRTVDVTGDLPDLLTSDRPLYMSSGILDEKCFIALAVSPHLLFVATRDPSTFDRVGRMGLSALVKSVNELVVTQAEKFVYGAHERHLRFVENRLRRV